MMETIRFISFRIRKKLWDLLKRSGVIKKRPLFDGGDGYTFYKKPIFNVQQGNDLIYALLCSSSPVLIARVGTVEMGVWNNCIAKQYGLTNRLSEKNKQTLCNNAGFFPVDSEDDFFMKWAELYGESISTADALASFENHSEDYVFNEYCPDAKLMQLCSLEPYFFDNPWSKALTHKKILVIHPFSESITKQYRLHDKLFEDKNVLPKFELLTIKAVQSAAGEVTEYESWFEALDSMKEQIDSSDFDIAILGCGAYALPLGAYIKSKGKKAIVMAGATQLLFGIMGSRWEKNGLMTKFVNQYWTKPSDSEKPKNAQKVEGACYW